jgi:ribosomal protein S18 acetylase RimI-like enzyme
MSASPPLTFRPIQESDLPFLAELYASTRAEEMAQVAWEPADVRAFLLEQFQLQHQHYQTHYTGASFDLVLVDGAPAGRLYVARWPAEIRVMDIALLPPFKGRGFGRRMMEPLLEEADRTGCTLSLHVEQNNRVLAWYRRLGFVEAGVHGIYFRLERRPAIREVAS